MYNSTQNLFYQKFIYHKRISYSLMTHIMLQNPGNIAGICARLYFHFEQQQQQKKRHEIQYISSIVVITICIRNFY